MRTYEVMLIVGYLIPITLVDQHKARVSQLNPPAIGKREERLRSMVLSSAKLGVSLAWCSLQQSADLAK
jgi:hypothetical protein